MRATRSKERAPGYFVLPPQVSPFPFILIVFRPSTTDQVVWSDAVSVVAGVSNDVLVAGQHCRQDRVDEPVGVLATTFKLDLARDFSEQAG